MIYLLCVLKVWSLDCSLLILKFIYFLMKYIILTNFLSFLCMLVNVKKNYIVQIVSWLHSWCNIISYAHLETCVILLVGFTIIWGVSKFFTFVCLFLIYLFFNFDQCECCWVCHLQPFWLLFSNSEKNERVILYSLLYKVDKLSY